MTIIRRNSPRGLLNANPCSIWIDPTRKWEGRIPINRNLDGQLGQFSEPKFGLRAAVIFILEHARHRRADTIVKLIQVWMPVGSPGAIPFAAKVARLSGFRADEQIDLTRYDCLKRVFVAMIEAECRRQPYDVALIDDALANAGGNPPATAAIA